jgi:hypothetical protein
VQQRLPHRSVHPRRAPAKQVRGLVEPPG